MEYNLSEHGDLVEKNAAPFVRAYFPHYELVWKIYIGNKGNSIPAELPNYPFQEKRLNFLENSYTVLESAFFIKKILISNVFVSSITNFDEHYEFSKSFIAFFAYLGRLNDTLVNASNSLSISGVKQKLKHFYEARNIVMHGKKVPIIFDENLIPQMPILKTSVINGYGWDDNSSFWNESRNMQIDYVDTDLNNYFNEFMNLVDNQYAVFYNNIYSELKTYSSKLKFEYSCIRFSDELGVNIFPSSGSIAR